MLKLSIFGAPSDFEGCRNPLRVRGRTQQSVSARFLPVAVSLSCTAPYLTSPFLYVISLGKCICRSPCDSRRAKRGVLGAADFQNGFQNRPKLAPKTFFFSFCKNLEKVSKPLFLQWFLNVFSSQNGSKIGQKIDTGPPFFSIFFRA